MATQILLKTKTSGSDVVLSDLQARELVLGGQENSLFVRNISSDLLQFLPVDDASISTDSTWSSDKMNTELLAANPMDNVAVTNANYTAGSNERLFTTTSTTSLTITLPPSPAMGDIVEVLDVTGDFDDNNVTLDRNGLKIDGAEENLILDVEKAITVLTYSGSSQGWLVDFGGAGAFTGTDWLDGGTF